MTYLLIVIPVYLVTCNSFNRSLLCWASWNDKYVVNILSSLSKLRLHWSWSCLLCWTSWNDKYVVNILSSKQFCIETEAVYLLFFIWTLALSVLTLQHFPLFRITPLELKQDQSQTSIKMSLPGRCSSVAPCIHCPRPPTTTRSTTTFFSHNHTLYPSMYCVHSFPEHLLPDSHCQCHNQNH